MHGLGAVLGALGCGYAMMSEIPSPIEPPARPTS
jgi:hypothetical protein